MDLDPFEPIGISQTTVRFLDTFLLYCLLSPSPAHDDQRCAEVKTNLTTAVHEGRRPEVTLTDGGQSIELNKWATNILNGMDALADHLDQTLGIKEHKESLATQQAKVTKQELDAFSQQSLSSIDAQNQIEAADQGGFDEYLAKIMAAYDPLINA